MQPTGRRLLLMRHAKAEPYGPTDRDRPLTPSGRRDAAAVGVWLSERSLAPDHALVSSAARSTATCTEVRPAGRFDVHPDIRPEPYGPTDRDRPLTPSGRRDAAAVGVWLSERSLAPDHALVSSAARSTETCTEVRTAGGFDVDPDIRAELYAADADNILDAIATVPPEVTSLLYVEIGRASCRERV